MFGFVLSLIDDIHINGGYLSFLKSKPGNPIKTENNSYGPVK